MEQSNPIMYIGLDVDDNAFHFHGISEEKTEIIRFKMKPRTKTLLQKLRLVQDKGYTPRLCYEATYIGYELYRKIRENGFHCDIIAPSLTPEVKGHKVKTDRIDAENLAIFYQGNLLHPIYVPTEEDEQVRGTIRDRAFFTEKANDFKRRILSVCRLNNIDYHQEKGISARYWTIIHLNWLQAKIRNCTTTLRKRFEVLLSGLESLLDQIHELTMLIEEYAKLDEYKESVESLKCFRGIETLTALTIVTELGDVRRFSNPKKIVSFVGFDINEYSSGGKSKRYGISKTGNKYLRHALVTACQNPVNMKRISKRLRKSRQEADPKMVRIGIRAACRLQKKTDRMQRANKHINKIKIACARELIGFIWEALFEIEMKKEQRSLKQCI